MSTRYIRILEGEKGKTDIIGASRSVSEVVYGEWGHSERRNAVRSFLSVMGHKTLILIDRNDPNINEEAKRYDTKITDIPAGSVSNGHLEVRPPMSDDTVDKLAAFIIIHGSADGGQDGVMMFDQRPGHDRLVREWL